MFEFKAIILLLSIVQIIYGIGLKAGPIGNFDELKSCNCPNGCNTSLNMFIAKEGNTKSLYGNLTIPYDLDDSYTFTMNIDRWSGSEWKKDFMKLSGNACENINKIGPNIMTNFLSQFIPKVPSDKCYLKLGKYNFEKVHSTASDVKLPSLMYSKYRAILKSHKGTEQMICIQTTIIAQQ